VNGALASGYTGMKNRIINPEMDIDQRNNGASVTSPASGYTLDRWNCNNDSASKYSIQQNAGSVTPPAGFTNYLGITSLSSYSVPAGEVYGIQQKIEGFNFADLAWGTASAATVTLSFWVRSSITGTHSGSFYNAAYARGYAFTFTVSSANTWEYKTVTVAGDTSGTWPTTNGAGVIVNFNLGTGTTNSRTAGSWGAGCTAATGSVSIVGTNGATFYITGVQLERGSNATSFEFRDYGRELIMCQRYFQKTYNTNVAVGTADGAGPAIARATASSQNFFVELQRFTQVVMRTSPSVIAYSPDTGASGTVRVSGADVSVISINNQGAYSFGYPLLASTPSGGNDCRCHYSASAEL
jgi:hypothetical protein